MTHEILSVAFVEPLPGREPDCLRLLHQLGAMLVDKRYGRDALYRDPQEPGTIVVVRYWVSAELRRQAHEDPDLHRAWRELAEVCTVRKVYEMLEPVE